MLYIYDVYKLTISNPKVIIMDKAPLIDLDCC